LVAGTLIIAGSSVMFALVDTYKLIFIARAIHGVGASTCFSAGMARLAQIFQTEEERGKFMSLALTGGGLAVLIAPPIGGVLFQYGGQKLPGLLVASFCFVNFICQMSNLLFRTQTKHVVKVVTVLDSLHPMIDPHILIVSGTLFLGNASVAVVETLLPLWIKEQFNLSSAVIGGIFLPSAISYFVATPVVGILGNKWGRVKCIAIGMLIISGTMTAVTFPRNVWLQFASTTGIGLSMGFIDGSAGVILGELLDSKYPNAGYGLVYASADMAFALGYIVGPILGTLIGDKLSLPWAFYIFAMMSFVYIPLLLVLRNYGNLSQTKLIDIQEQEGNGDSM